MKRILAITNNLNQASFRLRIDALRGPLAQRGFELDIQVRPRRWLARRALLKSAGQYHAVILQRKMLDSFDARLLGRRARKIFFDIDDAVMHDQQPVGRIARLRTQLRFGATTQIIHTVVAGNKYLADIFRKRGKKVVILPTTVDPAHYIVKHHEPANEVRLVWIGSNSTLPYLE